MLVVGGEAGRLAALRQYHILDTPAEAGFDDIALLASQVCNTPVALVGFSSTDRQWFKARVGFNACEAPLQDSVCVHVLTEPGLLVIHDLREDARTRDNPQVTGGPLIRFYAGAPLLTPGGETLGALCVIDVQPRPAGLTAQQGETLLSLSRQVMTQLEMRRLLRETEAQKAAYLALNSSLEQEVAKRTADRDRMWRLSTDALVVATPDGTIKAVNPTWQTLLGWAETELLGEDLFALIHADDLDASRAEMARLEAGDTVTKFENRFRCRDGSYRMLCWLAVPEAGMINAVGRDVTGEHEAAALHRQLEERLRQSQKMEAVGQLTGGLAHDFNNLLTGITGNLELLQSRLAQGRAQDVDRHVTAAQGAARRAAALTQRLLAFSRQQTLDPQPTDVNRLVAGMEELIRRTVGPSVAIEVVGTGGLWATLIDQGQLENTLLNLCINGRDAMMPAGGRLTIETANRWLDERAATRLDLPAGQYVSLAVTDTGTGMTPEVMSRAFDPFFTTKPLGQGTGLGLSMIYGFARQSGGQVRIYSELGHGTTMRVYLPRHEGQAPAAPEPAEDETAAPLQDGECVLVVDDEPTVRMLVAEVLEELGCRIIEAADGPAGLKILQSKLRIDLLVTDVGLPGGMNGRQVADMGRLLRPGLKTLFITGYAENAVVGNGHLEPGMAVLTKPFVLSELARRIGQLLRAD